MVAVDYTISAVSEAGLDWSAMSAHQTPGGLTGDTFANTGREVFYIKNTDTNGKTVTFNSISTCSYGSDHDLAISGITQGKEIMIGPLSVGRFGSSVAITYSGTGGVTGVTVDVIQLPYASGNK
jgi:hypothetical protein